MTQSRIVTGRFSQQAHESLERELQQERAVALARIAGTLDGLLARLASVRESLAGLVGEMRTRRLIEHAGLLEEARRWHFYLVVQREALGLTDHAAVHVHYPLPEPIER